ncbi:hypothetical protein LOD99_2385 [Oopsacas minuta]|uniref:Uncharacterized protein n=1 Tax=Oopsacas minuta TaxID=111878 RepID=A0AAV7K2G6_9METZ|nr:hypothetical protein LOD99_2385 [Oopsacas minuta]
MSRVRIYPCTTYKKQSILSPPDEPLQLHTWDNLLFVSTKTSVLEIYNMSSLQIVGKFSTISQAETIIYSEYGNCIVTMERADSSPLHCFVRLYMGFPCRLSDLAVDPLVKESFVMVGMEESESVEAGEKYTTGGMTRSEKKTKNAQDMSYEQMENWEVERDELPTQAAVNCVGMCSHTGLLAVAWDMNITLYMLTQDVNSLANRKPIKCEVSVLIEMEIGFVVTTLVVEDIYMACLSESEIQVLKLQMMPERYTCAPREKKLDSYLKTLLRVDTSMEDESKPEIKQSEDFLQLRSFYSYPAIHVDSSRSNGRESDCYPYNIIGVETPSGDESEMENRQNIQEEHCIVFPSVSKESMLGRSEEVKNRMVEIWGPSRIIENRALNLLTPDGQKLTNSATEYTLSTTSSDEKSIDVFHTIKLIPEYIDDGDDQHLVGMCLLAASKKEGHFYDIFGYCRKVITFPFTKDLIDIVMSPGLMHVVYSSRVEVYITRSYGVASENARNLIKQGRVHDLDFGTQSSIIDHMKDSVLTQTDNEDVSTIQSPLYWLYQVSPSSQEMDIFQIGQSTFVNLHSCTNTDNRIAILSKYKPEVKPSGFHKLKKNTTKPEEIIWNIYILDITPLHCIAKQMEITAQPYINENPPIYFQLLCDAHFLRKSAISRQYNILTDEEETESVSVEPVGSLVISLTPSQQQMDMEDDSTLPTIPNRQQLQGLQKSCLLLADSLRQENEQLALQYYKQGSFGLNQFLTNSILHTPPMLDDDIVYYSLTPSTLKTMASSMCFSQIDASLLAKSILHKESLNLVENDVTDSNQTDCMVFRVFNLCVHLENNDEMKARECASELFVHSRDFSLWANNHINSFVSQDNDDNLSHLGMFLLIEVPTLIVPLLPTICEMGLIKASYLIELIKHNTEDMEERDEMILQFITDLIRKQNKSKNQIEELDLAIIELINLCFNLFEDQTELDTRKIDDICAEYRPHWLDCLPPFNDEINQAIYNGNIGKVTILIFIVQNILSSPFNSLPMSEKVLQMTQPSEWYDGIRALIYMKLGRYKELVILFLTRYQRAFPAFTESIKVQAVRYTIIRSVVNDILINTGENDLLSRDLRERACYFIVSLTRCMTYKEILLVLPDNSPTDLYKRCFDFHLHIEKSDKIIEELRNEKL